MYRCADPHIDILMYVYTCTLLYTYTQIQVYIYKLMKKEKNHVIKNVIKPLVAVLHCFS